MLCGTIGAFATRYLHREPGYNRFFVLYALFVAGHGADLAGGTIETLFAGWELVGLSSALLVAFFHERPAPRGTGCGCGSSTASPTRRCCWPPWCMHHLTGEGDFDRLLGAGPVAGGPRGGDRAAGAGRRAAAAGRRGRQVGAGAVLRLAAAGDGRADAVERRLLRRPVGPPGRVPAAAGQPAPGRVAVAGGSGRRPGAGDGRCTRYLAGSVQTDIKSACRSPRWRRSG